MECCVHLRFCFGESGKSGIPLRERLVTLPKRTPNEWKATVELQLARDLPDFHWREPYPWGAMSASLRLRCLMRREGMTALRVSSSFRDAIKSA
jgi:hypothetical protein